MLNVQKLERKRFVPIETRIRIDSKIHLTSGNFRMEVMNEMEQQYGGESTYVVGQRDVEIETCEDSRKVCGKVRFGVGNMNTRDQVMTILPKQNKDYTNILTRLASRSILTPDRSKDAIEHCCFFGNKNKSFVSCDLWQKNNV